MSYLEKNIAAMERWTGKSAAMMRAGAVPAGFEKMEGTDGTPTYLRVSEMGGKKKLEWLGGTSMPTSSAEGIVSSLQPGTVNGLALSIGTGFEWKAFVRKLSGHQALFVWESDAGLARMALEICDLSEELAGGKMVLVTGDNAAEELSEFLREHVGYEAPTVLHPLVTLTGEKRNAMLAGGEAMVRRVMMERQGMMAAMAQEASSQKPESRRDRVVAMTRGSRYRGERGVEGELARLRAAGVLRAEIRLDHFSSCSMALRVKTLVEGRPELVVGDFFRGQIGCLPATVAVETWVPAIVGAGYFVKERFSGMAAGDRVVVHAGVYRELLESLGVTGIEVRSSPLQKLDVKREGGQPKCCTPNVAVVGDLGVFEMAALGIDLPTQQAVYAAARGIVEEDYLTVGFRSAEDVLRRALGRAGVTGVDEAFRAMMLRVVRDALILNVPPVVLAKKLEAEGLAVLRVGEWPGAAPKWDVDWSNVGVLVHLSPWGAVSPLVMEAARCGVPIVAPSHPTDKEEGALPRLLKEDAGFLRVAPGQLAATIKSVLKKKANG